MDRFDKFVFYVAIPVSTALIVAAAGVLAYRIAYQ